jgi:hypothetical protein
MDHSFAKRIRIKIYIRVKRFFSMIKIPLKVIKAFFYKILMIKYNKKKLLRILIIYFNKLKKQNVLNLKLKYKVFFLKSNPKIFNHQLVYIYKIKINRTRIYKVVLKLIKKIFLKKIKQKFWTK